MSRPPVEVAHIIRAHGERFIEEHRSWLTAQHRRVLRAIARCRTAALGGHLDRCVGCDRRALSYNSCRNRHCPKCLTHARDQWLAARQRDLLPVGYAHVVFTLPHHLSRLALHNKTVVYTLLFQASAATLLEIAADRKHLGAAIGVLSVLHTWGQQQQLHPHVHCVVPVGGLSPDRRRWVHPRHRFFLPVKVLSRVFRGKVVAGVKRAHRRGRLTCPGTLQPLANDQAFRAFLRPLFRQDWVGYVKPPFGGPAHVLHYLARYTHRVAISNHRIVCVGEDGVTFRWTDYAHGSVQRTLTLSADAFLRRFLLHVLPKGFVRIRSYGFLAGRRRAADLRCCRRALTVPPRAASPAEPPASPTLWICPRCGAAMIVIDRLTASQIYRFAMLGGISIDSS